MKKVSGPELMEAEVCEVVGPKGRHNPDRTAKRHGHERGSRETCS
jgi:putative transposase